jgi:DNA mismatch endonuclease (patch repair protein)
VTDNMMVAQRSMTMSRIRDRDTRPELTVRRLLHARGLRYRTHCSSLPGKPDIVFTRAKVIVFVNGDFWHGWRFNRWKDGLAAYWRQKIERNMQRDARNTRHLRRLGWTVINLWEHEIEADAVRCVDRVEITVRSALPRGGSATAPDERCYETSATPKRTVGRA